MGAAGTERTGMSQLIADTGGMQMVGSAEEATVHLLAQPAPATANGRPAHAACKPACPTP